MEGVRAKAYVEENAAYKYNQFGFELLFRNRDGNSDSTDFCISHTRRRQKRAVSDAIIT
jgi:hypothetical protein